MAALISACATPRFEADVTRFNAFPEAVATGQTVLIIPSTSDSEVPAAAGLEFSRYADLIGNRLATYGYRPAAGVEPDIIAQLGYSVSDTGAVDNGSGSRIGIGVGGGSGGHHSSGVGIGLGTSFNLGGGPKPVFLRRLTLVLMDRTTGAHLFEGQATSRGPSPDIGQIMPILVDALLKDFPGQSGETFRVQLDIPE